MKQSTCYFKKNSILTRKNRNISKRPILLHISDGRCPLPFFCFFLFLFLIIPVVNRNNYSNKVPFTLNKMQFWLEKNRNISKRPILLYPMGVVHCLFFCFFLFLFLFASTDSGRQNSICWGQQLQKMRESYSFLWFFLSKNTTEFSVLSLIFLGLHYKVSETIESLYF